MPNLDASAEEINILTSIVKHLETQIQGATGPPTDIEAANFWWPYEPYNSDTRDYFVRPRIEPVHESFHRNVNGDNSGSYMEWQLMIDLFMKRVFIGTDLTLFPNTLTLIRSAFKIRDSIAVTDWRGGGSPVLTHALEVAHRERRTPSPEKDWESAGFLVRMKWIEEDATA